MGLRNWFRARRHAAPVHDAILECAYCADPVEATLDEVAADGSKAIYLCRCPSCGRYWGGHGCTPQFRWALTPEEAAKFFPGAFKNDGAKLLGVRRLDMSRSFCLIDLVSQGAAVQRHLKGLSLDEKLAWLAARGKLVALRRFKDFPQTYAFESDVGFDCSFFIRGDMIVFIGDNTTFTAVD
jgi:hypothetical protein